MVLTRKFSQFPTGTLDVAVGLESGANTKGTVGGSGGGSGVTKTLPQQVPPVTLGHWVRVTLGSGLYTDGQADNPADAEVIGIVIDSNVLTFTLQQSGYITSAMGIPTIVGLVPGQVQFLDTLTLGAMVPQDALIDGTVSRPVFIPDTPTSGWVIPYRPELVGGAFESGGGGGPGTDSNIVTINQNNTFSPGDVVRVDTPGVGGPIQYILAIADTYPNAQAVGVVCANPAPTLTQFTLQFAGYNIGSISVDDQGADVIASDLYYLSSTVPGKVTNIIPDISKPIYIPEQATLNLGTNAGYILPQRPLVLNYSAEKREIIAANAFTPGQAVFINANLDYELAQANTLARSQVAGIIIDATPLKFTVQQSGYIQGVVTGAFVDGFFNSGDVLYLSAINPGNLSTVVPATVGQVTKPVYVQDDSALRIGQILPQRPLLISGAGGGAGVGPIVQSRTFTFRGANNVAYNSHISGIWVTIPGFSQNITPTAATSNLKITVYFRWGVNSANQLLFRLIRDGNPVAASLGAGVFTGLNATASIGQPSGRCSQLSFDVLDPAVAAVNTVYALQMISESGAGSLWTNASGASGTDDNLISTITVEEIS